MTVLSSTIGRFELGGREPIDEANSDIGGAVEPGSTAEDRGCEASPTSDLKSVSSGDSSVVGIGSSEAACLFSSPTSATDMASTVAKSAS